MGGVEGITEAEQKKAMGGVEEAEQKKAMGGVEGITEAEQKKAMDGVEGITEAERCLFWAERIWILMMAILWSLLDIGNKQALFSLSYNKYLNCIAVLTIVLGCAHFYFLLWFLFLDQPALSTQGKSTDPDPDPDPSSLLERVAVWIDKIGSWIGKNPGFVLERLALLIWVRYSECRDIRVASFLYFCHMIIFPLLNVYFALFGYSSDFRLHQHHHQKEVLAGKNKSNRSEKGELKDVYERAEQVVFWVERLGFCILTLAWLFFHMRAVVSVSCDLWWVKAKTVVASFWGCTNLLYLLMYIGRQSDSGGGGMNIKNHPGFWLERLALLLLVHRVTLFDSSSNKVDRVLHFCFTVTFPWLQVYFAYFGYTKEFQSHHSPPPPASSHKSVTAEDGISPEAEEEIDHQQRENIASGDPEGKQQQAALDDQKDRNLMMEDHEKHYSSSSASASASASGSGDDLVEKMSKVVEERIHTKIVNALLMELENRQLDSCEAQAVLIKKLVEKYEEDNQRLKEQNNDLTIKFRVATKSAQLYRSLLHHHHHHHDPDTDTDLDL